MTEAERRRERLNMLRAGGVPNRPAGIATFPELPADSAEVHASSVIDPTQSAGVVLTPRMISAGTAKMGMIRDLVAGGVDAAAANSYATTVYDQAPDSVSVVDYERIRKLVGDSLSAMKANPTDRAIDAGGFTKDIDFMLTSMQAIFGGVQQTAFGVMSGESIRSAVERTFPDADIREDDGTVHRKSVFAEAVKGVTVGAAGLLMSGMGTLGGPAAIASTALRNESRSIAKGLLESDYKENLLTGQEVIEYWMHGDGLIGTKLPDPGTPERATYDAEVRDFVSSAYASNGNTALTNLSMGALAVGGAVFDVFADPLIPLSEAPKVAISGMRRIAPISSTARVTSAIADRTRRLTDTLEAVKDARSWVDETAAKLKEKPSEQLEIQHQHAKKTLLRHQNRLEAMSATGSGETFLLPTTPRVKPDHVQIIHDAFLSEPLGEKGSEAGRKAAALRVVKRQTAEASAEVRAIEKEFKAAGVDPKNSPDLAEAIARRDEWKTTLKWYNNKLKNPQSRLSSFLTEEVNRQKPYEPDFLQPSMADGPGYEAAYNFEYVDDAMLAITDQIGPGPITNVVTKLDNLGRTMVRGGSAVEVRAAIVDFVTSLRGPEGDFNLRNAQQMQAEALAAREDIDLDTALDDVGDAFKTLMNKYAHTVDQRTPATQYRLQALEMFNDITHAIYSGNSEKMGEAIQRVVKYVSGVDGFVTSSPTELRALQESGKPVTTNVNVNTKGGVPENDWDMMIAKQRARYDKVVYPEEDTNKVLRRIQDNIKRGIAQGAPEEEIIQWERTYEDVRKAAGTHEPIVERSKLTSRQILEERLHAQRVAANSSDPTPLIDLENMDPTQLAQRVAYGPDQTETAAEAARVLAAGGEIDDLPFYGMGIELYNTSYGSRFRPTSDTQSRGFGVKKGKSETEVKMNPSLAEDEWLGKDAWRTKIEAAAWQQTRAEKLGDFYTKALYPGSWNVRPAGILFHAREPMRVLQSLSPRLYTRVHDAVNAQHVETTRLTEFFSRELVNLGVYKSVNGSHVLDPAKSQRMFEIMNLKPDTDKYIEALNTLTEAERMSVRRIRQELDFMMDKLGVRNTERHIEGYISHVTDPRWHDGGARPLEERGMGATTEVFDRFLMDRAGGNDYTPDLALALDQYTRASARKLHMEPLFVDMRSVANNHLKNNPGDQWFGSYINFMINNFKGMPSAAGNVVDEFGTMVNARLRAHDKVMGAARKAGGANEKVGTAMHGAGEALAKLPGKIGKFGGALAAEGVRVNEFGSQLKLNGLPLYNKGDVSRTAMMVTALSYSSVLGGSGRYFPMAVATGLATTGSRLGVFNTLKGIMAMATDEGRALAKQAGIDKQWVNIMEDAAWTKLGHLSASMPSFNGVTVVGPSITATENLIRGWTFHASLGDLMRKSNFESWDEVVAGGMANAFMHEAVRVTEEVNHVFGVLGKPPVAGRVSKSGSAAATQFLSFIPKQMEELLAQGLENPGKIGQYMMISGYIQRVGAKIGLDMSDYVGAGFLPKSPDDATSITFELMNSLLQVTAESARLMGGEGGDPMAHKIAKEQLKRNAQLFIPFATVTHRAKASAEALTLGSLYADDGGKVYDYDLGQFNWDKSKSVAANLVNLPSGLLSESGDPSIPTDLPSILTGINSTQRRLERQSFRASRDATKRQLYRRNEIADALGAAVDNGDGAAFSRKLQEAIQEGMLPPDITTMVERKILEQALPRLLREQTKSDQSMLNMMSIMERERYMYESQFNYSGGQE